MEIPLPVVLHPSVAQFLETLQDIGLIKSIKKCLSKLTNLELDSGLRLKKLRGISERLWEVRIGEESRLIFSFYKSYCSDFNKRQTYIAVQDIYLEHDKVKTARERFPDETWIKPDLFNSQEKEPDYQTIYQEIQNEIIDLEIIESDIDELVSNVQWKIITTEDDWIDLILNKDKDLPLKLSQEESEIATHYGSVLLSGFAGTGKTTIGLYRLVKSLNDFEYHHHRLYVAYNPLLVNYAQEQFNKLSKSEINSEIFKFKTINKLCLDILNSHNINLDPEDAIDFQTFQEIYKLPQRQKYPANLVWEEIRGLIKGSQLSTEHKLLSEQEYQDLGKKRSASIPVEERSQIYRLAIWYQNKLNQENRFDEIDLARKVLKITQNSEVNKYQIIICDEVQDLTELQIELLLKLLNPEGKILFTGDTNQMISPSGFRWGDLTTRFYEHKLNIQQKTLQHNFRSINSLSHLATQFLKVRCRILEETSTIQELSPLKNHQFGGKIIQASVDNLLININYLQSGDAILVRTEAEREQLKARFASELVFTIEQAKGLEFDSVFILNFFQLYPDLWHQIIYKTHPLNTSEKPKLKLELNLLYVAITRARINLYLWENPIHELWQDPELKPYLSDFNLDLFVKERQLDNSNWLERGEYYFKAEFYPQAMECFKKAGVTIRYKEAEAKYYHKQKKYLEAAELYLELEQWEKSANLFEKIEQWEPASNCWLRINNKSKYSQCLAKFYEQEKHYEKAGQIWLELGRFSEAGSLFFKAEKWHKSLDCWLKLGDKYYKQQRICQAKILENESHWQEAAIAWNKLKRWNDERKCWFRSNNRKKQAEYLVKDYENRGQWVKVAQEYEILEDHKKAADNWQKAGEEYEINKQEKKANKCNENAILNLQKLANNQLRRNKYQEALSNINLAIKLDPNILKSYIKRVEINFILKNYRQAITDCEYILKIDSDFTKAYEYRGIIYLILAKKDLKKTVSINQENIKSEELNNIITDLRLMMSRST